MPRPVAALTELLRISPAGVDLDRFALAAGMTPREAQGAWRETEARVLEAEGHRYGFALAPSRCEALLKEVRAALTAYHQTAPESPGLELDRLRLALAERLPPPLFRALVKALVEDGTLAVRGASIHLPGHAAALREFEQRLWVRVRLRLEESGFDPSWVRDLARELSVPERAMRQLMKRLAPMGEVIEVAPDRFYRRHTVHQMASMLADMCATATNGTVTAAEFRDRIAIGRKLAIIILEYFDRTGVTIRHGDLRKVRPERACVSAPNWDPILDGAKSSILLGQ
jgi:selenocysteine-specific elongation factor